MTFSWTERGNMERTPEEIRRELAGHIGRMVCRCQESSWFSIERSLELDWAVGGFGEMEERFAELDRLFSGLLEEVARETSRAGLAKIARKSEFLEDRFEELDSLMRNRPRRKRAAFPWEKFFRMGMGEEGQAPGTGREERLRAACRALGLPESSLWDEIRKKVRSLLKEMHPDMRSGDRSQEGRMREILEAYSFLKEYHGMDRQTGKKA
ncbi:MAG: DnaJ domain-containing protein [Nitrospirae bacterium]|nr:DnaJ domain-containing protein [Nitrospirota bacterium]MCL5285322.1 DnaJ domain-containing protein [Nitrospirota bacterium]